MASISDAYSQPERFSMTTGCLISLPWCASRDGDPWRAVASDVLVPRRGDAPPYILSIRPLVDRQRSTDAAAIRICVACVKRPAVAE